MRKPTVVLASLLILAACGSMGGLGDLGGILGSPSASQPSDISGTVSYVDTTQQRIDMNVDYVNNLRSDTTSNSSIYYDSQTRVVFQGRDYASTDLERGDQVSVRGVNSNGRYVAQTITVTRNVRG